MARLPWRSVDVGRVESQAGQPRRRFDCRVRSSGDARGARVLVRRRGLRRYGPVAPRLGVGERACTRGRHFASQRHRAGRRLAGPQRVCRARTWTFDVRSSRVRATRAAGGCLVRAKVQRVKSNRLAVVVGGGNGIGEATCRLMVERDWRVVVADRDIEAAQRVAQDVSAVAFAMDLASEDNVDSAASAIIEAEGLPDALVVAGAVFQDVLPPERLPIKVWERTLQVNLTGTWLANRAFGVPMAAEGRGSIVNI